MKKRLKRSISLLLLVVMLLGIAMPIASASTLVNSTWVRQGTTWYYRQSGGANATGWQRIDGVWYYFGTNGAMATGWQRVGNVWYYLQSSGAMATGWQRIGGVWYFLQSSGAMATGWLQQGSTWYYLQSNGAMATSAMTIGGVRYDFRSDGSWAGQDTSGQSASGQAAAGQTATGRNGWHQDRGTWYYYRNDKMVTGWLQDGSTWYLMRSNGAMATGWQQQGSSWYFLQSSGAMATGWLKEGTKWYHLKPSGAMTTGWLQEGAVWYYLQNSGVMATSAMTINGVRQDFNSNGVWKDVPRNPLTGHQIAESQRTRRPLAISLGNTSDSLPMNGITKADIVYEVLVEYGITRMVGLFQDISSAGRVGSIRSARPYIAQIAESFDAVLITAGGSPQGYDEIRARGITHIDETVGARYSGLFSRDRDRIPGRWLDSYHSAVITGPRATQQLPTYGIRLSHGAGFYNGLSFIDNGTPSGGRSANNVTVTFSNIKSSTFSYNSQSRTYVMSQPSGAFTDANDGSRPAFTNLLILRTDVAPGPGWGEDRQDIRTTGSGTGFFVCGGRYIDINWSRASKSSPFVYTLRDGTPVNLGRGTTYIGIIPATRSASFS